MVSLTVSDGTLANTATVSITTINQAPVANAGAGQSVNVGITVALNGSASSDPDGDVLWTMTSKPAATATLASSTYKPNDKAGAYMVSLTVSDGTTNRWTT